MYIDHLDDIMSDDFIESTLYWLVLLIIKQNHKEKVQNKEKLVITLLFSPLVEKPIFIFCCCSPFRD